MGCVSVLLFGCHGLVGGPVRHHHLRDRDGRSKQTGLDSMRGNEKRRHDRNEKNDDRKNKS